jgi:hypothetical protein
MTAIDLLLGRRKTGISVHPDPIWPKMFRVHRGDRVSDMVNLCSREGCRHVLAGSVSRRDRPQTRRGRLLAYRRSRSGGHQRRLST